MKTVPQSTVRFRHPTTVLCLNNYVTKLLSRRFGAIQDEAGEKSHVPFWSV